MVSYFAHFKNLALPSLFPSRVSYTFSGHNANMIFSASVDAPLHSATAHCKYRHHPAAGITQTPIFAADINPFRYILIERLPPFQPIEL
jgi:hypothetical protein